MKRSDRQRIKASRAMYRNQQLQAHHDEVSDIAAKVAENVKGIRITVSPISEDALKETDFTHILDVGDEYSFFYTNENDALLDQAVLATHLRLRGAAVSKVHRNEPFTLIK